MKREIHLLPNGKFISVKQLGEKSALLYLNERIEYWMPIYTVDVNEIKKVIDGIHIVVKEPITPEEAGVLLNEVKSVLLDKIENMPKYKRYLYTKEDDVDNDNR